MKIAVLSDIHGNLAALQAIAEDIHRWQPDQVVLAGDIVNRGPLPRQCLDFALEREHENGWMLLRGNHEEYVINVAVDPSARLGAEEVVRANVRWTAAQIGDVASLRAMPNQISLQGPHGGEVRIVHASMRHNRDNILIDTPDDELRAQIAPAPTAFCCGHTHRPLVRQIDATLVVNAGAVGLPFDGDVRGSYARLNWRGDSWAAEIIRVPYDRDQTTRDYEAGFLSQSGPIAPIIFSEFRTAHPRLSTWYRRYETALIEGRISIEQSVAELLADTTI